MMQREAVLDALSRTLDGGLGGHLTHREVADRALLCALVWRKLWRRDLGSTRKALAR